jgi:hypothetical protein
MKEKENILKILKETKKALKEENVVKLKEISNHTIHSASIEQNATNLLVAVLVYSLSKIIERKDYQKHPGWNKFYKLIMTSIDKSLVAVSKGDEKKLIEQLELVRKAIRQLSGKLKIYIQDVFRKASVNKASRIYEHGISMERTASLLGITMFELSEYAGKTRIADVPINKTLDVKSRINLAMEMFE